MLSVQRFHSVDTLQADSEELCFLFMEAYFHLSRLSLQIKM